MISLQHEVSRDFLIFLLLTGMRCGETTQLKWDYVDFKNKILTVPQEITKGDRELQLPLSDFLVALLRKRHVYRDCSEWVFPSVRLKNKPISGSSYFVRRVRAKSGVAFTLHDLRRSFMTMGAKLEVPPYALKRLVNHSVANDMTARYLVLDVERLRTYMTGISNAFVDLMGINDKDMRNWAPADPAEVTEVTQLRIDLTVSPAVVIL